MYFITGNTLCSTTWYLSWKCKFKLDSTSCVYSFYPLSWLYVREVCDGRTSFVKRGILSAKSYFSTLPTHPEMKAQVSQKAEHVKRNHGNSATQNSNPVSIITSLTLVCRCQLSYGVPSRNWRLTLSIGRFCVKCQFYLFPLCFWMEVGPSYNRQGVNKIGCHLNQCISWHPDRKMIRLSLSRSSDLLPQSPLLVPFFSRLLFL